MNRRGFLKLLGAGAVGLALKPSLAWAPRELSVPISWSGPSDADKIAMVRALIANAIQAHNDAIEEALFTECFNAATRLPQAA